MKKYKILLLTLILMMFSAVAVGCDVIFKINYGVVEPVPPEKNERIGSVENVALSDDCILSWTAVAKADKYKLEVNGVKADTSFVLLDLKQVDGLILPKDGKFKVEITTVAGRIHKLKDSVPYSGMLVLNGKAQDMPEIKLKERNVIELSIDTKATDFRLTVNGTELNGSDVENGSVRLTDITVASEYQISLQGLSDGVYVKNSPIARYAYTYNAERLRLPQVSNARMEGLELVFDSIDNAAFYRITDLLNNTYEVKTFRVDMRERTLPKSIVARSGDIKVDLGDIQTEIKFFTGGEGTKQSPYQIGSSEEFRYIEYFERQNLQKHYVLTQDVVFPDIELAEVETGSNYMEIGSLSGVLDGGGYKLKNVVAKSVSGFVGLFDSVAKSGVVKNLTIEGFKLKTWRIPSGDGTVHPMGGAIGVITKDNYGSIENVKLIGNELTAEFDDVSLVHNNHGTVSRVTVDGNTVSTGAEGAMVCINNLGTVDGAEIMQNALNARRNIAGICSLNYGVIKNSNNNMAMLYPLNNEVGGIVSWNEGFIINCQNSGAVTAKEFGGGIAGKNSGTIESCTNSAKITAEYFVGGISGFNEKLTVSEVLNYANIIKNCSNTGEVNANSFAGGIVGDNRNGFVYGSKNSAAIRAANADGIAGGIAAQNGLGYGTEGTFTNAGIYTSYNVGAVTGAVKGGIAGVNSGYRYNTSGSPFVKQANMGIYNCYSVGVELAQKNNQICDSFSNVALSDGTFMLGAATANLTSATEMNIANAAFLTKLKAAENASGMWKAGTNGPMLFWEA